MRKQLAALAFVSALALPGAAQASVTITFPSTAAVPAATNDFTTHLFNDFGVTQFASSGATMTVDVDSNIAIYFLGSESGFDDTFTALGTPNFSYGEASSGSNYFGAPLYIGTGLFTAGSNLAGLFNFSTAGADGAPATVGDDGFSIFLGPNAVSGESVSSFVFGYDDQITGPDDDNHDDMIFHAVVTAVPEPATWAMMLLGFGAVGAAMRRKRPASRAALA